MLACLLCLLLALAEAIPSVRACSDVCSVGPMVQAERAFVQSRSVSLATIARRKGSSSAHSLSHSHPCASELYHSSVVMCRGVSHARRIAAQRSLRCAPVLARADDRSLGLDAQARVGIPVSTSTSSRAAELRLRRDHSVFPCISDGGRTARAWHSLAQSFVLSRSCMLGRGSVSQTSVQEQVVPVHDMLTSQAVRSVKSRRPVVCLSASRRLERRCCCRLLSW